jgi:hypothetical protein
MWSLYSFGLFNARKPPDPSQSGSHLLLPVCVSLYTIHILRTGIDGRE